jgi:hypothetical protein
MIVCLHKHPAAVEQLCALPQARYSRRNMAGRRRISIHDKQRLIFFHTVRQRLVQLSILHNRKPILFLHDDVLFQTLCAQPLMEIRKCRLFFRRQAFRARRIQRAIAAPGGWRLSPNAPPGGSSPRRKRYRRVRRRYIGGRRASHALDCQLGRDRPQRHAPPLRLMPVQTLRQRDQLGIALGVALAPFALAAFKRSGSPSRQ